MSRLSTPSSSDAALEQVTSGAASEAFGVDSLDINAESR